MTLCLRTSVRAWTLATLVVCATAAGPAWGDVPEPSYGRVQGDLTLGAGLGALVATGGVRAEADLRVRYLESAGLFASYEDGALLGSGGLVQRAFAAGLEVRPLFFYRWLTGLETRRAGLDLVVDSFGLELGAFFLQPQGGDFASRRGAQVGLGLEFPLLGHATGPWIGVHAALRWSEEALAWGAARDDLDRSAFVAVTLAWHQVLLAHIVDAGDRAPY
jgi:hypothetical protein